MTLVTATTSRRAFVRGVSARRVVRPSLLSARYTRWQVVPAPEWDMQQGDKAKSEVVEKRFKGMTLDLFEEGSEPSDIAIYTAHDRSHTFACDEIGANVVFTFEGGAHPSDSSTDTQVLVKDNGSAVAVMVDGEQLGEGQSKELGAGSVIKFDDAAFKVLRDVRAKA